MTTSTSTPTWDAAHDGGILDVIDRVGAVRATDVTDTAPHRANANGAWMVGQQ